MVYVQDIDGKPMMPTTRHGKVRRLLKANKATVVNLCPFTIRLMYATSGYKQEIVLGVDAGTKHVGLSATTKSKELYSSEVILRSDIVELLSTRRELRRTRRNRLRYRKPRFDNRVKSKHHGWVAPSVRHKVDAHIRVIDNICSTLPISRIIVEIAQFDTQKIKNPDISGNEYQEGDQLGFWNVREYVLARDGHNRQIHKQKVLKGGAKKPNQSPFEVFGFRLFDRVMFEGNYYFIFGRRKSGSFNIRDINGGNQRNVTYKKLKLSIGKRFMIQKEMN